MRRVPDDGLIKIANLNLDFPSAVSDRAKIAHVAIPTNPDSRPLGKRAAFQSFEPLVIAHCASPHVSVRGSDLDLANSFQDRPAAPGTGHALFVFHNFLPWVSLRTARESGLVATPLSATLPTWWQPLVGLARPDLRQQLFRLHLLLQTFVQQGRGFRHVELTGPRNECAVARHLIMFDRLARRNQTGIDRGAFAEILDRFLTLRNDAIYRLTGLGLGRLPIISNTCSRRSIWPCVSSR